MGTQTLCQRATALLLGLTNRLADGDGSMVAQVPSSSLAVIGVVNI
jgi:hypothetical protein